MDLRSNFPGQSRISPNAWNYPDHEEEATALLRSIIPIGAHEAYECAPQTEDKPMGLTRCLEHQTFGPLLEEATPSYLLMDSQATECTYCALLSFFD